MDAVTPEDLAAIRAKAAECGNYTDAAVEAWTLALADALEQAWTENEELNERIFNAGLAIHWRERAERAEHWRQEAEARAERAEAALARVRALCDEPIEMWRTAGLTDMRHIIRAAVGGTGQ